MKLHKNVVVTTDYDNINHLLFNSETGTSIKVSKEFYPNLDEFLNHSESQKFLEKNYFTTDNRMDYLKKYHSDDSKNMRLILLVHENCNFRCSYCYETFKKNKMTSETINGIINLIKTNINDNADLESVTISWFGGEPLLAIDVILKLGKIIRDLCLKNNIKYFSDMTTNGSLLTKKTYEKLHDIDVSLYQITLDGTKEYHDRFRKFTNGKGSYNKIINNLLSIKETNNKDMFILRTNVGADNLDIMDEHIKILVDLFGEDSRFMLSFHNIGNWGENESNIIRESISMKLQKKAIDLGANVVPIILSLSPGATCYAAKLNSFVIGSDGKVYKCTVALYENVNNIGVLKENGTMILDSNKHKKWTTSSLNDNCLNCVLLPNCLNNQCPLNNLIKKEPCLVTTDKIKEAIKLLDYQNLITYTVK